MEQSKKDSLPSTEKCAINTHARTKLTVIVVRKGTSISMNARYRVMKFATRLRYEYVQVAVDLFFEKSVPFPFEAMVCFCSTLPPFVS